jgi:hypothetical protein
MEVVSPNGNIQVSLKTTPSGNPGFGMVSFDVKLIKGNESTDIITSSPLGISRKDLQFTDNVQFVKTVDTRLVTDEYQLMHGKRRYCHNEATEKTFRFINPENQTIDLIFRAYDDGIAFRYSFPEESDSSYAITDETTAYFIPDGTKRWIQSYRRSYEDFYRPGTNDKDSTGKQEWGYPALFNVKDQPYWFLITEAGISRSNCATRLRNLENLQLYKVTMPEDEIPITLPWKSQWHVVIIGSLNDIVESTLVTDVSEPCTLTGTEWIEPGAVSWVYWAHNHGSKDYQIVTEYIDQAVEMNWPYVLIDWEWDQMGNGGDITDAVRYANNKGVKPLMWYNSGTAHLGATPVDRLLTPEKREKEYTWLNRIGVAGIKVDFFAGDIMEMMNYYIDLLEDAFEHHLLVNFHGATIPRGWNRTYPNLMTVEAVYGAEWYNNKPVLTNEAAWHNTTLPFTRNVVGPMDYTPVTFSDSQHPHITSYGHELALSVVFESGLQHFADRPSAYNALPAEPKNFLKTVPVAWDDTRLVDGYPGEKVVMARKKEKVWYIGGINGLDEPQTLTIDFKFLDNGDYNLEVIKDGTDDKSFEFEAMKIKKGDFVKVKCLPRGGFVGLVK